MSQERKSQRTLLLCSANGLSSAKTLSKVFQFLTKWALWTGIDGSTASV